MPRSSSTQGTPVFGIALTLLGLMIGAAWQARGLAAGEEAPPAEGPAAGTLDAGVPLPPDVGGADVEPVHSQALATRELTRGMLAPAEPSPEPLRCAAPRVAVEANEACFEYPPDARCRWRLPEPEVAGHAHERWRNTHPTHWWGRPALVSIVLAVAHGYADKYPGERLVVGDLDAAGPRHTTHDRGVDVDLYLPGVMETDNAGGGLYPSNYRSRPHLATRMRRARVQSLAKLLASCTEGALRIYYNDRPVADSFEAWFRRVGFASPFGRPMRAHNALHRFHFHVTIDEALPPLPGVTPLKKTSEKPSLGDPTGRTDAPARPPRHGSPRHATGARRTGGTAHRPLH